MGRGEVEGGVQAWDWDIGGVQILSFERFSCVTLGNHWELPLWDSVACL